MNKPRALFRWGIWVVLIAALAACRPPTPTPQILPAMPSPTAAASVQPSPSADAPQPTAPPTAAPPSPTAINAPTLLDRYPLMPGTQAESIAVTPGRVWVGTTFGRVEEYDAASGALVQFYSIARPSVDGLAPVKAIASDGARLWALAAWDETFYDQRTTLWVFDLATSQVLAELDVSEADPQRLGVAPGQIWLQNQVIDAETRAVTPLEMPLDAAVFAYDGAGVVWAAGAEACDDCASNVYRYMVIDPANPAPGPHLQGWPRQALVVGEHIWLLTDANQAEIFVLRGDAPAPETPPARTLDLSALSEDIPAGLAYDGQYVWLLSSYSHADGTWLFRLDVATGRQLSAIQVAPANADFTAVSTPVALAFDGTDLWVLSAYDLARVVLPWARK